MKKKKLLKGKFIILACLLVLAILALAKVVLAASGDKIVNYYFYPTTEGNKAYFEAWEIGWTDQSHWHIKAPLTTFTLKDPRIPSPTTPYLGYFGADFDNDGQDELINYYFYPTTEGNKAYFEAWQVAWTDQSHWHIKAPLTTFTLKDPRIPSPTTPYLGYFGADMADIQEVGKPQINTFTPRDTTPKVEQGESLSFSVKASHSQGLPLSYSWTLDGLQMAISKDWIYTPGQDDSGLHPVSVTVSDGTNFVSQSWQVTVNEAKPAFPDFCSCSNKISFEQSPYQLYEAGSGEVISQTIISADICNAGDQSLEAPYEILAELYYFNILEGPGGMPIMGTGLSGTGRQDIATMKITDSRNFTPGAVKRVQAISRLPESKIKVCLRIDGENTITEWNDDNNILCVIYNQGQIEQETGGIQDVFSTEMTGMYTYEPPSETEEPEFSSGITPDSIFYSFDKFFEKIQLAITRNKAKRAKLHIDFANERLSEAKDMIEKNKMDETETAITDYQENLKNAGNNLMQTEADKEGVISLSKNIARATKAHKEILKEIENKADENLKQKIKGADTLSKTINELSLRRLTDTNPQKAIELILEEEMSLCGNGRCDEDETNETCSVDCQQVSIKESEIEAEPEPEPEPEPEAGPEIPEEKEKEEVSQEIEEEVGPVCGDNICEGEENCSNCQADCLCPTGDICDEDVCKTIVCSTDADCNDGDVCTIDNCQNPGTAEAVCNYTNIVSCINDDGCCPAVCNATNDNDCSSICGNGICEAGENQNNCCSDCSCPEHYLCQGNTCLAEAYCGDGTCGQGENYENCPDDCPAQCNDGIDNDGDGLVDYPEDLGCQSASDNEEINIIDCHPETEDIDCEDDDPCTDWICEAEYDQDWQIIRSQCMLYHTITECYQSSDGCCPTGCTYLDDPDCLP